MNELDKKMADMYVKGGFENEDEEMSEMLKYYNYTPKSVDDFSYEKFNVEELANVCVMDVNKLDFNYIKRKIDIPLFKLILNMNRNENFVHIYGMSYVGKTYFAMYCAKLLQNEFKLVSLPKMQLPESALSKLLKLPKGSAIILDSLDKLLHYEDKHIDALKEHFGKIITISRDPLDYGKMYDVRQFHYTLPFEYEQISLPKLTPNDFLDRCMRGVGYHDLLLRTLQDIMEHKLYEAKIITEYIESKQYSGDIFKVKDVVQNRTLYILNEYGSEHSNYKELFKLIDIEQKENRTIVVKDTGVIIKSKFKDEMIYITLDTLINKNNLNNFIKKYIKEYINTII